MSQQAIIDGYAVDAADLIPKFEELSTIEILDHVIDLVPTSPCRVLEVGAGTGRDAAWFASMGHKVVAVEPVDELRLAGAKIHPSQNIVWLDDRLPTLEGVVGTGLAYDLIVLIAVWQHVPLDRHEHALRVLTNLLAPSGRLIISVRHVPGSPTRLCFQADVNDLNRYTQNLGLRLVRQVTANSVQQKNRDAGVTWTWLCWERPG